MRSKKRNLILGILEREVARRYLPIRLLIALHFPLSEQTIATLEVLRIVQGRLDTLPRGNYLRNFDLDEFSPRTVSEWLKEIPSSMRSDLTLHHYSALKTLFLYVYRDNAARAQQGMRRWESYREPPPPEIYPRYEYYGGIIFRYHY